MYEEQTYFIFKENEHIVKGFVRNNPNTPFELMVPLVIRANVGDLITVEFENKTGREASIRFL